MIVCTHGHNEQNRKNSVLDQECLFYQFRKMQRVQSGCGKRMYSHERKRSILSCPFATLSSPNFEELCYAWGKNNQSDKPCFQAHHKNKNNLPSSHSIFLSPSSVCLFTWKINGKIATETQHKVSIEVGAAGHGTGAEEKAWLPPGPISNIGALSARGLSAVMNMTALGLCAAPFIPFERK